MLVCRIFFLFVTIVICRPIKNEKIHSALKLCLVKNKNKKTKTKAVLKGLALKVEVEKRGG